MRYAALLLTLALLTGCSFTGNDEEEGWAYRAECPDNGSCSLSVAYHDVEGTRHVVHVRGSWSLSVPARDGDTLSLFAYGNGNVAQVQITRGSATMAESRSIGGDGGVTVQHVVGALQSRPQRPLR